MNPWILNSNVAPFRWLCFGPIRDEVKAAACKFETPNLEKILRVINSLQQDGIYHRLPGPDDKHANLRHKKQQLSQRIPARNL